jgi:hypothetical protein
MSSNVTIGNLTTLSTVTDSTVFASEDNGFTRKVTAAVLKNYMTVITSLDSSGAINAGGGLTANTIQAGIIGNVGTILTGTLSTNAQPNITSLGTLANLTVSGNAVMLGNVILAGNLSSNALASFAAINSTPIGNTSHSTGRFTTLTATTINAGTIGNSGATLTGTLSTAAQPNITGLGTITNFVATTASATNLAATTAVATNFSTGNAVITGGSLNNTTIGATTHTTGRFTTITATTVNAGTIGNSGATLTGTLSTAAQPNITSVGTLTTLSVSGTGAFANVSSTNGFHWANGTPYSTSTGISFTGIASNVTPSANVTYDLGSTTAWWNNVYGVAIQAKYADLAENYTALENYLPGTVVAWSTDASSSTELVLAEESHTPLVAGVISTNPAYLMNSVLPGVPLALSGRVPCQVLGPIARGDRLAVVAPGVAGRLDPALYQPGCVIGYALASVPDGQSATIEVVIMKF